MENVRTHKTYHGETARKVQLTTDVIVTIENDTPILLQVTLLFHCCWPAIEPPSGFDCNYSNIEIKAYKHCNLFCHFMFLSSAVTFFFSLYIFPSKLLLCCGGVNFDPSIRREQHLVITQHYLRFRLKF